MTAFILLIALLVYAALRAYMLYIERSDAAIFQFIIALSVVSIYSVAMLENAHYV